METITVRTKTGSEIHYTYSGFNFTFCNTRSQNVSPIKAEATCEKCIKAHAKETK